MTTAFSISSDSPARKPRSLDTGDVRILLLRRHPQIYGLTKRRVADARRTERNRIGRVKGNRIGRVKGDRIGSVKATLPEHQYRPDYNRDYGVARLQTRRKNVGGTLPPARRRQGIRRINAATSYRCLGPLADGEGFVYA